MALEPVDANGLLEGLGPLVERAVGERVLVRLAVAREPLWCQADPGQLESALLNLSLNARDAMPAGGSLVLSTSVRLLGVADLRPGFEAGAGEYVEFRVADSGVGMRPEVLAQVFEPFYTTKGPGRGTGLGLSQVYGFARQLGGQVFLETAEGAGTTAVLQLPRSSARHILLEAAPQEETFIGKGSARLLLVESDETVRLATSQSLEVLGFHVSAVATGAEALRRLRDGDGADVLFADIELKDGLSGIETARAARVLRPGLPVLLTSGRSRVPVQAEEFAVLWKPFRLLHLVQKINDLLHGAAEGVERYSGTDSPAPMPVVLVVDDDELIRTSTAELLQHLGYVAEQVSCGADALAILAARGGVDVLLTDIQLPDISGLALAETARRRWPHMRVVAMTGADDGGGRGGQSSLLDARLPKPFSLDDLRRSVGRM
jgi:CheY-like chemotaxis protein